MNRTARNLLRPEFIAFALLLVYPLVPAAQQVLPIGGQLTDIFIFAILALGLNVVVGYTGLLHLGIAAFFGIGAYITGILTYQLYPFQSGLIVALVASTLGAAIVGVVLAAPTLRLRGDYLAIVTLGFGEVVRFALINLDEITGGVGGLSPIPARMLPGALADTPLAAIDRFEHLWMIDYRLFYYFCLLLLAVVFVLLSNLERSRLGRAWVAIREDELAATCMGINAARAKLSAFAMGSALAGLAGCLYATKLSSTAQPDAYDFNRSVTILACVILGGLASLRGTVLGVFLLLGFDNIVAPMLDSMLQQSDFVQQYPLFTFSNWRLMIFGLALILMMRLRPEGLLPSSRVQHEFHSGQTADRQPASTS